MSQKVEKTKNTKNYPKVSYGCTSHNEHALNLAFEILFEYAIQYYKPENTPCKKIK